MADNIEYLEHIRSLSESKDPMLTQFGTIDAIAALLRDIAETDLVRRIQPGE